VAAFERQVLDDASAWCEGFGVLGAGRDARDFCKAGGCGGHCGDGSKSWEKMRLMDVDGILDVDGFSSCLIYGFWMGLIYHVYSPK
jgi:hypothetical protein